MGQRLVRKKLTEKYKIMTRHIKEACQRTPATFLVYYKLQDYDDSFNLVERKVYFQVLDNAFKDNRSRIRQLPFDMLRINGELDDGHPTFGFEVVTDWDCFNYNQDLLAMELRVMRALTSGGRDGKPYGMNFPTLCKIAYPGFYELLHSDERKSAEDEVAEAFHSLYDAGIVILSRMNTLWYKSDFLKVLANDGIENEIDKLVKTINRS